MNATPCEKTMQKTPSTPAFLCFFLYLFNIFDFSCTTYLTTLFSVDVEGNPIMRILFGNLLTAGFFKIIIVGLCVVFLYKHHHSRVGKIGIYLCLSVYALLAAYHCMLLLFIY